MIAAAEDEETEEEDEEDEDEEAREVEPGDERQAYAATYARWRSALREATSMDMLSRGGNTC